MERRGFLSLLGLGGTGLLLPQYLVFEPEKLLVAEGAVVNLEGITLAMATEIERALGGYKLSHRPAVNGARLGRVLDGAYMTNQPNVTCALPVGEEVEWRQRYVEPAGSVLAHAIKDKDLRVISNLANDVPWADTVVVRAPKGLHLRGALLYDAPTDQKCLRFDLIGGHA